APGLPRAQVVALEHLGGYRVDAVTPAERSPCKFLVQIETRLEPSLPGSDWRLLACERRNTNDDTLTVVYGRVPADASH
ncbi:MAG: hypothetical protein ABIQ60_16360, partial [Burkholderiaceae bacterium]